MELENILINLNSAVIGLNHFRTPEITLKVLPIFTFQTEERIKELKKEIEEKKLAEIEEEEYETYIEEPID